MNFRWRTPPSVLQGVGDGTFIVTGHVFQLPGYSDPSVGADFNGDGATDLVELVGATSTFHTIPAAVDLRWIYNWIRVRLLVRTAAQQ